MKAFAKNSATILLILLAVAFVEFAPQVISHIILGGR
jgi:hypothetical protein